MQISWNGLGSFTITGKPASGDVTVVTDPYDNAVGLRFPRTLSAAIVVQSHDADEANNIVAVAGAEENKKPFVIPHAGEYEVQGVFVHGINAPRKDGTPHTIYRITMEGMKIGFLGAIDRELSDEEYEALGDIDILLVPAGGGPVLDAQTASAVVAYIEPRIVVPSYVESPGLKVALAGVEAFCKELACPMEKMNKLTVKKGALPAEEIQLAILARG